MSTETETRQDTAARLEEIAEEIKSLADEALDLYTAAGGNEPNARSYWHAHILCAVGGGGHFTHATTMTDAINEMAESDEPTCPSCDNVTLNDGYLCDACAEDACPGCGCMPGDGETEGCTSPDGCGR